MACSVIIIIGGRFELLVSFSMQLTVHTHTGQLYTWLRLQCAMAYLPFPKPIQFESNPSVHVQYAQHTYTYRFQHFIANKTNACVSMCGHCPTEKPYGILLYILCTHLFGLTQYHYVRFAHKYFFDAAFLTIKWKFPPS